MTSNMKFKTLWVFLSSDFAAATFGPSRCHCIHPPQACGDCPLLSTYRLISSKTAACCSWTSTAVNDTIEAFCRKKSLLTCNLIQLLRDWIRRNARSFDLNAVTVPLNVAILVLPVLRFAFSVTPINNNFLLCLRCRIKAFPSVVAQIPELRMQRIKKNDDENAFVSPPRKLLSRQEFPNSE